MLQLRRALVLLLILTVTGVMVNAQNTSSDITLPTYQGYISVAPNGRYFVDEAGQGFLVIGQNDGVPWPGLSALLNRANPEATEGYVRDLRAHGITVSRVMIEYAQAPHTYLENPVGTYSESMLQFWDDFIAIAEAHGLYLLLTPYDTFWQHHNWATYPYNAEVGGPCATRREWITGAACIEAQKARWRTIIDRWGGSPNIFAWDLMNEIDIWWGANSTEIDAYITEMAAFVRAYETEKWGRTRLIGVSSAAAVPDGALGRVIYNHPALDFANTHQYLGADIKAPKDTIGAGPAMAGGVALSLESIRDKRPYFDSETGPIDEWIANPNFDAEYHHNMSWAHLAAGGAGSGMRWPYTTPHWILPEMRDNLLGLARLAATIDWANFDSRNVGRSLFTNRREILDTGITDGQTALIWLLLDTRNDESVTFAGAVVSFSDLLEPGAYSVEFWETYDGRVLTTMPLTVSAGDVEIPVPDFDEALKDLALVIRRQP